MNICLFGAASGLIDKKYAEAVTGLGEQIAERGHTLIFGGGATGLMGAAALGAERRGGRIIGVAPEFFREPGVLFERCTEMIYTETIGERIRIMEDRADCFVMAPGGVGTLQEFFDTVTLRQLGRIDKPIAAFNVCGYFDGLVSMLGHAADERFIDRAFLDTLGFFTDPAGLLEQLERECGAK